MVRLGPFPAETDLLNPLNWQSLSDHATVEKASAERHGKFFYSAAFLDRFYT